MWDRGVQLKNKRLLLLEKELAKVQKAEEHLKKISARSSKAAWKEELEQKIPPKARAALNKAFYKAFSMVFEKGTGVIEKTFDKDAMVKDQKINEYAVKIKGGRKEIRRSGKEAAKTDFVNLAVATAEGVGLGIFGIGLFDVVLFVGVLLKGIYQAAVQYGFRYEDPGEKYVILMMMEAAVAKGEEFVRLDEKLERFLAENRLYNPSQEEFEAQLENTARAFAADMLLLKFIQGIPVAGILGGAANPVYYRKVLRYAGIKYHKRYLVKLRDNESAKDSGTWT